MVFIVIPPTDVDVGSPIDEKLTTTIKQDLDDLDARTNTNTTDIAALAGGGGGGGGGFKNLRYFDAPGTWTTPATIEASISYLFIGSSGGGGGATGVNTGGAPGGASTQSTFMAQTFPGTAGGGISTSGVNNFQGNSNVQDRISFKDGEISLLNQAVSPGAAVGYSESFVVPNSTFNITGGAAGGSGASRGGYSKAILRSGMVLASTVYPFTIGQAGGGGGGGSGANGPGGAGGGPGGGGGGVHPSPGGAGGLVPHSFLSSVGSNGVQGPSNGGMGGGSGVHSGVYINYND